MTILSLDDISESVRYYSDHYLVRLFKQLILSVRDSFLAYARALVMVLILLH